MKISDFNIPGECRCCGHMIVTPDHVSIGAFVKAKRNELGMKLRYVSARTGLSIGYLSDLEHGRSRWTQELFEKVLNGLKSKVRTKQ